MLGIGSYGYSYLVSDGSPGMKVLKQLRKRPDGSSNFLREKEILRALRHPHIPKLLDDFEWGGRRFIVMEQMPGKTFEDLIFEAHKTFSEQEAFHMLRKVLDVTSYFHRKGIVHGDLRIPNILFDEKENAVSIIDFGMASYGEKFHADFEKLGHFTLFLLYSGYRPEQKKERPWYEELPLSGESSLVLKKMLQIEKPYETVDELIKDVDGLLLSLEA